jgi:hypothetical protein
VVWVYGLQEAQLVAIGVVLLAFGWWRSGALAAAPVQRGSSAARA